MHQWIRSALIQVMACRLFGAKALSKPMLGYCQLDPYEQKNSEILIKIQNFSFIKNASEHIICEMAAILSRWRLVKLKTPAWHFKVCEGYTWCLTHLVLLMEYSMRTRSIPQLLMPWLLALLGQVLIIPPPNEVGGGVYWIHLVRPSVRPSVRLSVDNMVSGA